MLRTLLCMLVGLGVSSALQGAPCQDRLRAIEPLQVAAGGELVLHGEFAAQREARRPVINRGNVFDLEVQTWSPTRIVARVPAKLAPGSYKVGIYCNGRPGPQRFLHASGFIDVDVVAVLAPLKGLARAVHQDIPKPLAFEIWLAEQAVLSQEIVWESMDGPEPHANWPESRRQALYQAFRRALEASSSRSGNAQGIAENLAEAESRSAATGLIHQRLSAADAERLYLASLAQSLALEYRADLPWSLSEYPRDQLEILLDSREMFRWRPDGYEVEMAVSGMVLADDPSGQTRWMQSLLGKTRRSTIINLLNWMRDELLHFEGAVSADSMHEQWQYVGFPPVSRILSGTPHLGQPAWPERKRTAGCFGSAGLLRALLRAVNIPVRMRAYCRHYQVEFPSEGLFLSHGDDPYSGDFKASGCSAERLLIDADRFDQWFVNANAKLQCDHVGRQAREVPPCK
ncbi:hypothetical protein [Pseudomarimonas arenosa]|uniref:Transglutaminase-like domain-containing protein n=1 Tax=Pseudomarimonas arenosa TaxID=2774145 RepID=A0AAW3ZP89_9GAMM|nr:hypothetical protein [Pseudomarimonas arenosa]MBD8526977.1 hypothetical protein [Pseudomarimonas arenosa]